MLFRKIENFLSDRMDTFLTKRFSRALQMNEVEDRLLEELSLKKCSETGKTYIPDDYTLILAETDYAQLNMTETFHHLYRFLVQTAIERDFYFKGEVSLQLAHDMVKDQGSFSVQSQFSDQKFVFDHTQEVLDQTIVFQKGFVKKSSIDYSQVTFAVLQVMEGEDRDFSVALGKKRMHMGRRVNNEVPLQDINCSRLHAYIVFEDYRHVLYDAGSLNGTYVNGRTTQKHTLRFGDEIKIGSTLLLYDMV